MKTYKKVGNRFMDFFPGLALSLSHANIKTDPEIYLGRIIVTAVFILLLSFALFFSLSVIFTFPKGLYLFIPFVPLFLSFLIIFYNLSYPKLLVSKRVSDIEKNLLFSLRHMLIEIKSGINLYDSFLSLAQGDHGAISYEFREVTKKISVGVPETKALEEVMLKNPSNNFRRVLWQITNAIEAGYDIADVLEELVKEFSAEHKTAIRMYGSQLNSFALVYMIFAIILPSIGICFLVILSFFSGFPINSGILVLILLMVVIFQVMFLGIVKSKRPKID